jgi:ABC-type nitrate/sulfonate/bicarbonate transport system substrate-binding protein
LGWQICFALLLILLDALPAASQEKHTKVRISNAGFTITALPLLAAKDWGKFTANGLDVELIVMSPSIAAAAVAQGDIDYVAGVGPASVAATLSGLQSRAIWFSSDRISYWLLAPPQFKTLESLKGKKIAISGGAGGTNHVALMIALEKSGANPKDYTMVGIPGAQIQVYHSLESGFVDAALLSPPVTFSAAKKGYYKIMDVGSMVEMPGGGLTTMIKTIQSRPAEVKRVIHALQSAKDDIQAKDRRTDYKAAQDGQRSGKRNLRRLSDDAEPKRRAQPRRHRQPGSFAPGTGPLHRSQNCVQRCCR